MYRIDAARDGAGWRVQIDHRGASPTCVHPCCAAHDDPHPTREDATACFQAYFLARAEVTRAKQMNAFKCKGCGKPTNALIVSAVLNIRVSLCNACQDVSVLQAHAQPLSLPYEP